MMMCQPLLSPPPPRQGLDNLATYVMVPGDIFTKIRNRSKSNLLELKRHCRRSIDSLCASLQTIDKHPTPK